MNIPGDIFSEFEDQNTESKQLLSMLKERMPEGRFEIILNHKKNDSLGDNLNLSCKDRDEIVNRTKKENGIIHMNLPGGRLVYSTAIKELDAILACTLSKQTSDIFINNIEYLFFNQESIYHQLS